MSARTREPAPSRPTDRLLLGAGTVYVAAWLIGLVAAPARPTTGAPEALAEFVRRHTEPLIAQSALVHGLAGLALVVIALRSARLLGSRTAAVAGAASGGLSLVQVALLLAAVRAADGQRAAAVSGLLDAVDAVDAAKLLSLAAFAGLTTVAAPRSGVLPRWLRVLGGLLAVLLVVGAVSFVPGAPGVLGAALVAALPLLLVHVGGVAVVLARHAPVATTAEVLAWTR